MTINIYRRIYRAVSDRCKEGAFGTVLWAFLKVQRRILVGLKRIAAQGNAAEGRIMSKLEDALELLKSQKATVDAEFAALKEQNTEVIGTLAELKEIVTNPDGSAADVVLAVAEALGVTAGELKAEKVALDEAEKAADPSPEDDEKPAPEPTE